MQKPEQHWQKLPLRCASFMSTLQVQQSCNLSHRINTTYILRLVCFRHIACALRPSLNSVWERFPRYGVYIFMHLLWDEYARWLNKGYAITKNSILGIINTSFCFYTPSMYSMLIYIFPCRLFQQLRLHSAEL